jgi:hypothetical protein
MTNLERFPRLARALVAAGVPVGAHADLLTAAAQDMRAPPVHGIGFDAPPTYGATGFEQEPGEGGMGSGDPAIQASWAVAFGTGSATR